MPYMASSVTTMASHMTSLDRSATSWATSWRSCTPHFLVGNQVRRTRQYRASKMAKDLESPTTTPELGRVSQASRQPQYHSEADPRAKRVGR